MWSSVNHQSLLSADLRLHYKHPCWCIVQKNKVCGRSTPALCLYILILLADNDLLNCLMLSSYHKSINKSIKFCLICLWDENTVKSMISTVLYKVLQSDISSFIVFDKKSCVKNCVKSRLIQLEIEGTKCYSINIKGATAHKVVILPVCLQADLWPA